MTSYQSRVAAGEDVPKILVVSDRPVTGALRVLSQQHKDLNVVLETLH